MKKKMSENEKQQIEEKLKEKTKKANGNNKKQIWKIRKKSLGFTSGCGIIIRRVELR